METYETIEFLTAANEKLRKRNTLLVETIQTLISIMTMQRDVVERGAHWKAWTYPIDAANKALKEAASAES